MWVEVHSQCCIEAALVKKKGKMGNAWNSLTIVYDVPKNVWILKGYRQSVGGERVLLTSLVGSPVVGDVGDR
jgi:hypothetical protein